MSRIEKVRLAMMVMNTAKIKPETNSGSASENLPNNIYSLKLEFYADGTVPNGFEINDVTVIYRQKSVK